MGQHLGRGLSRALQRYRSVCSIDRFTGRNQALLVLMITSVILFSPFAGGPAAAQTSASEIGPRSSQSREPLTGGSLAGETVEPIEFVEVPAEASRDGYLTLTWETSDAAALYRLSDQSGAIVYQGHLPKAFISGLLDGEHAFSVIAMDAGGEVIGRSPNAAVVQVSHWPMLLTWTLFVTGALVMLALFATLGVGVMITRQSPTAEPMQGEVTQ